MARKRPLALVGSFPRDGVFIKNTDGSATFNSLILNMSIMSSQNYLNNEVIVAGNSSGEGHLSGRCDPLNSRVNPVINLLLRKEV